MSGSALHEIAISGRSDYNPRMYAEDSFYSLTMAGRAGLIALSALLAAATLLAAAKAFRRVTLKGLPAQLLTRIALALLLFFAFEWLSPQIYYLYYQWIFDGLPWQIVIKRPPGPLKLFELLAFSDRATFSHHSRGALGWALIGIALIGPIVAANRRR